MKELLKIKRSLISISDKTNIIELARFLNKSKIEIISTGNTFKILNKSNINAEKIEKITNFPEILDGRVKTLHPNVYGGILANLKNKKHLNQIRKHNIKKIQLIIVNLYPFAEVSKASNTLQKCIENIDIGGPSLIRAAAKNYLSTAIVVDINDYSKIRNDIEEFKGISLELRKFLAAKAFQRILEYDYEISKWFNKNISQNNKNYFLIAGKKIQNLRYGENPHQSAGIFSDKFKSGSVFYKQLNGKELSFNNLNDLKAALNLLSEFHEPASVIIKHAIPCGVSEANNLLNAWKKSFLADRLSAFGGVVALNRIVDDKLANELSKIFLEVIVAKGFTKEALKILQIKSNLRIIKIKSISKFKKNKPKQIIAMSDIFLIQDSDNHILNKKDLKVVSKKKPSIRELDDLIFAHKVVKHVRSNAIVIAKNKTTLGIGSGNTSRIDSVNFALQKSKRFLKENKNRKINGAVMSSDAFFPFTDSILLASKAGIKSIIQPGGSVKDKVIIEEVDRKQISMVFTNKRCFSH